jgi:hypothetical protein
MIDSMQLAAQALSEMRVLQVLQLGHALVAALHITPETADGVDLSIF